MKLIERLVAWFEDLLWTHAVKEGLRLKKKHNCGARIDGDKDNNVRNLTNEETAIYESWIESEAKDTGINIVDGDGK